MLKPMNIKHFRFKIVFIFSKFVPELPFDLWPQDMRVYLGPQDTADVSCDHATATEFLAGSDFGLKGGQKPGGLRQGDKPIAFCAVVGGACQTFLTPLSHMTS